MKRAPEIDAYLAPLPDDQRATLEHLRAVVAAAAPEAEETITYAMPGLRYRGRPLISYLAAKKHLSLFAMGYHSQTMESELAPWQALKGTLHFSPENPIPDEIVTRLVRGRIAELDAKHAAKPGTRRR